MWSPARCSPASSAFRRRGLRGHPASGRPHHHRRRRRRRRIATPRRRGGPRLFAVGLIGASILAASILPLSTAYSVCEYAGAEAAIDDPFREARTFYLTYGIITLIGTALVLAPDAPLVAILVGTQVLNAVLLIPLLAAMVGLARDRDLMGSFATGRAGTMVYGLTTAVVVVCVITLGVTELLG